MENHSRNEGRKEYYNILSTAASRIMAFKSFGYGAFGSPPALPVNPWFGPSLVPFRPKPLPQSGFKRYNHTFDLNACESHQGAHPRYRRTVVCRTRLRRYLFAQHHRRCGRESGGGPLPLSLQRSAAGSRDPAPVGTGESSSVWLCSTGLRKKRGGIRLPLEKVIEAFVAPTLRCPAIPQSGSMVFMRLLGRLHAEGDLLPAHPHLAVRRCAGAFWRRPARRPAGPAAGRIVLAPESGHRRPGADSARRIEGPGNDLRSFPFPQFRNRLGAAGGLSECRFPGAPCRPTPIKESHVAVQER